jgi:excisionase family DNA binding protein
VEEELLSTEEVAGYLGVGQVTVWRWCREGTLPCAKIGRSWRIRRSAVEEFVRKSERSGTLVDRLRTFLEESDNVLAIVQTRELMLRLNVAFFRVGEARGGILIRYRSGRQQRSGVENGGPEARHLEDEDRLRFLAESDVPGRRAAELRRLVEERPDGRSVWVNFDWEKRLPPEAALEQQRGITELTRDSDLVVMTNVLDPELDEWPGALQRRAHLMHSGAIWLSDAGLALSRVAPLPAL